MKKPSYCLPILAGLSVGMLACSTPISSGDRGRRFTPSEVTEDLEEAARWDDIWPFMLASGYAVIAELDRSFHWLDRAIEWGISNVRYLEVHDPFLANLRSEPRLRQVVAKAETVTTKDAAVVMAA